METQEDSIDIAALQRVALGLDSQLSQPFTSKSISIENRIPLDAHDLTPLPHPKNKDFHLPSAPRYALDKPPANEALDAGDNAAGLLSTNCQSPGRIERPFSPKQPIANMGSAEILPSDTQVISQSVYDEIIRKNKEAGSDGLDSNNFDQNTLRSLHVGDLGHIDLLSQLDGAPTQAPNTDENDDQSSSKLGESSPLTYERNHFPESQRFLAKTPVTATKQHSDNGISTISPLAPHNPLAPNTESQSGILGLSQVFNATQAPSSPLVNGHGLQSDLLSDRPSPNIPIQHRPLGPTLSSPFNTIAATFPREFSDMQLNYVSVMESQAKRDERTNQRMTRSANDIYSEDQSDGEFDKEPSFLERAKRQRRIDQETAQQFARLSAPARRSSTPETRKERNTSSSSGDKERQEPVKIPTAPEKLSEQNVGSEEETEQEEDVPKPTPSFQVPNSSTEENKENCDDPSALEMSNTESAHDRLSQALSLHESPQTVRREPVQASPNARLHAQNGGLDGPVNVIRSSPISVVRDSQWSPSRDLADIEQVAESPSNRTHVRLHGSQPHRRPMSGHVQQETSSAEQAVQPSDQGPAHYDEHRQTAPNTLPSSRSDLRFSNPSREGTSAPQTNGVRFGDLATANGEETAAADPRGKSSSMPSRVAETPVHRRQRSSITDPIPFATIPETSPNQINNDAWMSDGNNEAADQEDDDLPPPLPRGFERATHSQPVISETSSPMKPLLNSKILSSPSGRQRRALTEIASDVSPQVGGLKFDVTGIDIMSADDHEFRSAVAMSPIPPRKKRRGNDGRNIPASDPIVPLTPRARPQLTPPREEEVTGAAAAAPPPPLAQPEFWPRSSVGCRSKPSRRSESFWDVEDSPKFRVSSKERSRIFARSQARKREPSPAPAAEPESNEILQSTAAASSTPVPTPPPAVIVPTADSPPAARAPSPVPAHAETMSTPTPDVPSPDVPSSEPVAEESPAERSHQHRPPETTVLAPNAVLAPWRGQKRAYYPAACFGKPFGTAQDQYLVKFEDSAPLEVPIGTVKRLELRVGDAVKIDMPNVPKVTHIIRGFAHRLTPEQLLGVNGFIPVTDVYGHATLIVGPKQRKSLPSGGLAGPENVINVPVSRIYLDTILWNQLKERAFTYDSESMNSESRLQTPSEDRHTTPTSPGTGTRLSRSFRPSNGLFSGMVFAVSYGDKGESKFRVTKMILENDGQILEDGFNELFEFPSNALVSTPSKSPALQQSSTNAKLRLRPGAEEVGFACLIADRHSRRAKYMQALALGLPCLSDRWVEDCVAKGQILDWEMYLLPAGESSYLNGATKSRILMPYSATRARLSDTVASRPNLLNGQSVLLITGRTGKADEERRKAYIFLTYALGASKIERVPDVRSARALLNSPESQSSEGKSSWDWVYIDDDPSSLPAKKRRKSRSATESAGEDLGLDTNVRIVGNEFVCQSLILGRLVDM